MKLVEIDGKTYQASLYSEADGVASCTVDIGYSAAEYVLARDPADAGKYTAELIDESLFNEGHPAADFITYGNLVEWARGQRTLIGERWFDTLADFLDYVRAHPEFVLSDGAKPKKIRIDPEAAREGFGLDGEEWVEVFAYLTDEYP